MKIKHIVIILIMLFVCGCSYVKDESIDDIVNHLSQTIKVSNVYHTGYKYYLPDGMQISKYMAYNDTIEDNKYKYYLYTDMISYYNKVQNTYEPVKDAYYSALINYDKYNGLLEINLMENGQYLVEIVYNYAKIEVMVDESDINSALTKSVSILRSIKYNDKVIESLIDENSLTFQEENYNIFNTTSKDSNYLQYSDGSEELPVEEEQIELIE